MNVPACSLLLRRACQMIDAEAVHRESSEDLMRQVKLFKGIEAEVSILEKEVNAWIRESGVAVHNITGNIAPQSRGSGTGQQRFAPSDVLIIVDYESVD